MPACGGGRAERSRARDERGRGDDDDPNSSPPEHARVGEGRFPRPSVRRARASVHHSGGGAADLNHAVLIVVVHTYWISEDDRFWKTRRMPRDDSPM